MKHQRTTVGDVVGASGVLLIVLSLFLPWYSLGVCNAYGGAASTNNANSCLNNVLNLNGLGGRTNLVALFAAVALLFYCLRFFGRVVNIAIANGGVIAVFLGSLLLLWTLLDLAAAPRIDLSFAVATAGSSSNAIPPSVTLGISIGWVLALLASVVVIAGGLASLLAPEARLRLSVGGPANRTPPPPPPPAGPP